MDIKVGKEASIELVRLKGRFDAQCSDRVAEVLDRLIAQKAAGILIDMESVDYISSIGLRVLLSAAQKAKAQKLRLALCSLDPYVYEVFEVAGFVTIFEIHPDRQSGLKALASA